MKYIGLDVHQSTISVAVLNAEGKLLMQSVITTKATAMLDLLKGLRGVLHLTFEEGTYSAWLYDVVVRQVARVVVCNPRKNALLKSGNKSDQIDARKLAELPRAGMLSRVYHGEQSTRTLQPLVAGCSALTEDTGRAMRRIKALYRSQAIACAGKKPFGKRHRGEWLARLTDSGQRRRAEWLYQELDAVQVLRREARQAVMVECHKNRAAKLLRSMPFFGPLRAMLIAFHLPMHHAVLAAVARLQPQPTIRPELAFAAEAMRRLHPPISGAARIGPRNGTDCSHRAAACLRHSTINSRRTACRKGCSASSS